MTISYKLLHCFSQMYLRSYRINCRSEQKLIGNYPSVRVSKKITQPLNFEDLTNCDAIKIGTVGYSDTCDLQNTQHSCLSV